MDDVLEVNNPLVIAELLQNSNLTDGRAGDPIVTMIYFDLFNCYNFIGAKVFGHVDDSVGALSKLGNVLKSIGQLIGCLDRPIVLAFGNWSFALDLFNFSGSLVR